MSRFAWTPVPRCGFKLPSPTATAVTMRVKGPGGNSVKLLKGRYGVCLVTLQPNCNHKFPDFV